MSYLIHSAKGTSWSNHKYIKKIGDKYYYKETLDAKDLKTLTDEVMAGKHGTGADLQKNLGGYYAQVMQSVNSKFKKSGSGKKSSKSGKSEKSGKSGGGGSSKGAKEAAEKTTKETSNSSGAKTVSDVIKSSISKSTTLGEKDALYSTKNDDGTTTVTVDYEDGTTQTFTLNESYEVTGSSERKEKEVKHSAIKGLYFVAKATY